MRRRIPNTALEDASHEDADLDEHEVSGLYESEEDHACSLSDADVEVVLDDQIECDSTYTEVFVKIRPPNALRRIMRMLSSALKAPPTLR